MMMDAIFLASSITLGDRYPAKPSPSTLLFAAVGIIETKALLPGENAAADLGKAVAVGHCGALSTCCRFNSNLDEAN